MKKSVELLLVALMATSSMTAASDTLKVESFREIDLCSGEKRFLITVSIGQVYFSDSLQSFDITIGYDTTTFTPTDGLITGTLAEQMNALGGPFFNFLIPGEMRAGGFTINDNVAGNKPVFAIAGTYKGTCTSRDTFSYPWPATFNEEFKGTIKVFHSDTVVPVLNSRIDNATGIMTSLDTLSISGKDSLASLEAWVNTLQLLDRPVKVSLSIAPQDLFRFSEIDLEAADSVLYLPDSTSVEVFLAGGLLDTARITVRSLTDAKDTTATISMTMTDLGDCGCIKPGLSDSFTVRSQTKATSLSAVVVDEDAAIRIHLEQDGLHMQNLHGQPWTVTLTDMLGGEIFRVVVLEGDRTRLDLLNLSSGMYMVAATNGTQVVTRKLIK